MSRQDLMVEESFCAVVAGFAVFFFLRVAMFLFSLVVSFDGDLAPKTGQ